MTAFAGAALATLLTIGMPSMSEAATFVYVSDAGDATIDAYVMDAKTGALTSIGRAEAGKTVMPMAVAPNKRFLYAVVRSQPMRVLTYAIDGKSGALTQKATAPLPDSMPYVSTDPGGRFLFTASYGGDKVAVSPIDEDGLVRAEPIQVLPTGRNAHSILADRTNRFVYAALLGANEVLQFAFDADSGKLAPLDPPAVTLEPGHGPRHLALSGDNKFLYVLNELSGYVAQYAINGANGTLKLIASVPSVPPELGMKWGQPQAPAGAAPAAPATAPQAEEKPAIWAADLRLTPNGKFLYTTERNTDKIALFTVARARARSPTSPISPPSGSRAASISIRADTTSSPPARNRIGSRSIASIKRAESSASRRGIRWEKVRTGSRSSKRRERIGLCGRQTWSTRCILEMSASLRKRARQRPYSKAKRRFQSFFMLITVQPSFIA